MPQSDWDERLTAKRERFVEEYLVDLNGTQAAIRAGYAPASAEVEASRLLSIVKVRNAIDKLKWERSQRTQITADWALQRLALLADSNIKDVMSWNGSQAEVVDSDELSWQDAYSIKEVALIENVKESADGKETILTRRVEVKQHGKENPLKQLYEHTRTYSPMMTPEDDATESAKSVTEHLRDIKARLGK